MIIQIRGTSGSGKSTAMRQVMERLGKWKPVYVPGRKQPMYYVHETRSIMVLGHYEVDGGGCDNIGSAAKVYELIQSTQLSDVVLCEGLLLSEDTKWTQQLQDVHVIYLSTPIETCISQIKSRRLKAGNEKPLNESNTRNRVNVIERSKLKLTVLGTKCYSLSFQPAVKKVLELIANAQDSKTGG